MKGYICAHFLDFKSYDRLPIGKGLNPLCSTTGKIFAITIRFKPNEMPVLIGGGFYGRLQRF